MNEDDFYSAGMNEFQKIIQEYQEKFEQSRIEAAMMDGAEQLARRCAGAAKTEITDSKVWIRPSTGHRFGQKRKKRGSRGRMGKILRTDGRGRNTENECTAAPARTVQKRSK